MPLDSNGLTVRMFVYAYATGSSQCWTTTSFTSTVTVRPSSCAQSYGTHCGVAFTAEPPSLIGSSPAHTLAVHDPTPLPFGVLFVGTQRLAAPLPWGCTLWTNYFASVPLSLDAVGRQSFGVIVPPGTFTMQVATFGGTTVHMSDGLEFVCP